MLKMNKDLTTSSKDALLLLNIYILRVQSLDPRNIELAINLWPSYWCITKAYYLYWNTKTIGVNNNSMWAIINGQVGINGLSWSWVDMHLEHYKSSLWSLQTFLCKMFGLLLDQFLHRLVGFFFFQRSFSGFC